MDQIKNQKLGVEVYLTKTCNLKCRGCLRYCPIAENDFYSTNDLFDDLKLLKSKNIPIMYLTMSGGECLMHPDLVKILYKTRELFPDIYIGIFTNLKRFEKIADTLIPALKETKTEIIYTQYKSVDTTKALALCSANGIKCNNLNSVNSISPKVVESFEVAPLTIKPELSPIKNEIKYQKRCFNTCPCLWKGKIWLCGKCAFADTVNKKYGTNFEISQKDYITIEDLTLEKYFKFISKSIPFCKYCYNVQATSIEWSTNQTEKEIYVR